MALQLYHSHYVPVCYPILQAAASIPENISRGRANISGWEQSCVWNKCTPPENSVASITEASPNIIKDTTLNMSLDWQKWALIIWIVVAGALVLWNVLGLLRFRYQLQQSQTVHNALLQEIASHCAAGLGIKQKVALKLHSAIQSPMLVGFFTPTIIIPNADLQLDEAQMILAHELVHFKHRALWRKLLAVILQTVYWFNPVVYLIKRDLDRLAETSCDEQVVCRMNQAERKSMGIF